jgi:hypothetical protein
VYTFCSISLALMFLALLAMFPLTLAGIIALVKLFVKDGVTT